MTFNEYLQAKKIDTQGFALAEPEKFREYKRLFDQVHPESFTAQKLFVINRIRRKYPLKEISEESKKETPPAKLMRPKLNITPKTRN